MRTQRIGDLLREFAGRGEHQCPRVSRLRRAVLVDQPRDQREPERQGLAGTRAGPAQDIAPCESVQDGPVLHRGGSDQAMRCQLVDERPGRPSSAKVRSTTVVAAAASNAVSRADVRGRAAGRWLLCFGPDGRRRGAFRDCEFPERPLRDGALRDWPLRDRELLDWGLRARERPDGLP